MFQLWNAVDLLCVRYPLFQIKGSLKSDCGCTELSVTFGSSNSSSAWPLCGALFKVLVLLNPGQNLVRLSCLHHFVQFRLIYAIAENFWNIIKPVYVICADDDGTFEVPERGVSNDINSAVRRIGFGIRLLQTLTAEGFYSEFGKRYTFYCDETASSSTTCLHVPCMIHHTKLTREKVYSTSATAIWSHLAKEFFLAHPEEFSQTKWIAFMACTRRESPTQDPRVQQRAAVANYALGTGGLALLGTSTLHAWPEDLDAFLGALLDTRRLDHLSVIDDTAFRHTFWAAFATGLGSAWHELGHCLGLDHSIDGIMFRGGDDVHLCLGFPPSDSQCPHGCGSTRTLAPCRGEFSQMDIPPELNPPPPYPRALQFQQQSTLLSHQATGGFHRPSPFASCHSLWHQGSAFWGAHQIGKLVLNAWIFSASSETFLE